MNKAARPGMKPHSMKQYLVISFLFLLLSVPVSAQQDIHYMFRLQLTDKGSSAYYNAALDHPQDYLSPRALARRERQNIPIDETDLPDRKSTRLNSSH